MIEQLVVFCFVVVFVAAIAFALGCDAGARREREFWRLLEDECERTESEDH